MRINKLCFAKPQNLKITQNKTNPIVVQKQNFALPCDSVNFSGKHFRESYEILRTEIIDYVMSNSQYSEKEIEQIIQRQCPNASFEEAQRVYFENSDVVSYCGNTEKTYSIQKNFLRKREATLKKQVVSAIFPANNSKEEKVLFISRLLHECTHALQGYCKDKTTELEVINKFLAKKSNNIGYNLSKASSIYESLYAELLELSSKAISANLPKGEVNPKNLTAQSTCAKYYGETPQEMAWEMLNGVLSEYKQINKEFVLDYCIQLAQCEVEAYANEIDFLKTIGYDYRKTLSQIKIELNEAIIDAANSLKNSKNFS